MGHVVVNLRLLHELCAAIKLWYISHTHKRLHGVCPLAIHRDFHWCHMKVSNVTCVFNVATCKTFSRNNTVRSHDGNGAANHRQIDCLFDSLFILMTKKPSKLRITGPLWGETNSERFPSRMDRNAKIVPLSSRHHEYAHMNQRWCSKGHTLATSGRHLGPLF